MALPEQIDFTPEQIEVAGQWYGGQGDILYAVASTGALRRGTQRPTDDEGKPVDDDTWLYILAEALVTAASRTAHQARDQAKRTKDRKEKAELKEHSYILDEIADEAQNYCEMYEKEYGR